MIANTKLHFLALLTLGVISCGVDTPIDDNTRPVKLVEMQPSSHEASVAVEAIIQELRRAGEDPSMFYVTAFNKGDGRLVFSLLHEDDYLPENRMNVGNPSDKGQKCEFNKLNATVRCLYYQ